MRIISAIPLSTLEISLVSAVLILVFVIWRLTRHQECGYSEEPAGRIGSLRHTLAGLTHGTVTEGNKVSLIRGARFFDEVVSEMKGAGHSIHLETFLWEDGKASDMITEALCGASLRGVEVRILADARGSSSLGGSTREKLADAGCNLHFFHPWKIMNLGRFNIRDHRKIIVIDGRTAFVGGHCITDAWLEDRKDFPVYRDISARLEGAVVNGVQSAFAENWIEADCNLFVTKDAFQNPVSEGGAGAHVAYIRPDGCPSSVQILHHIAIGLSKEKIRIQNPYFLPDPVGSKALRMAARRGVDVRIMVPAVTATDSFYVAYAGQSLYQRLLEAGVRIFEYQPTLLHQKIITVDGEWCGIGSCNFDDRSFEINDEIMVGVFDKEVVSELDGIFEDDIPDCVEISLEKWKKRSAFARFREKVFYLFNEQF